jgi:hypothetical protein
MAGRRLLGAVLIGLLATVALPEVVAAAESPADCTRAEKQLGICATVNDDEVRLDGTDSTPGVPGHPSGPPRVTSGPTPPRVQDPDCVRPQPNRPAWCYEADEPGEPGIPPITISDIATFVPTPGRQQMEPDGWTVAGLDTNFYAITGAHVVNGTLLGRPADVRFTPTAYRWTYGDGTSATKHTKGGTWAALGIAEFERTPTSHVYEQIGDYTITLDIVYAAEYRFDGGSWTPVIGTITLPANDLHIRAGTAKTVIVEHDCLANPSGPGC